jgi:phage regulator Rha-like protein
MPNTEAEANLKLVAAEDGDPVTTTLVIAQGTNSEHRAVLQLVRTHQARFEEFGLVAFEMRPRPAGQHGGGDVTYAVLNEYQASLLLTFMRNNEAVVEFKVQLIQAFRRMREELQQRDTPDEPSDARELALQTQLLARRADALASALIATQDALEDE